MIDFQPNSSARIFVKITDEGSPLTGATVKVTVTNPAGTTIVNNQSTTEEGSGVYSYTLTASQTASIGTYFVTWNVSSPTTIEQKTTFSVGYESAYAYTVLDIRHAAARLAEGKEKFHTGVVTLATINTVVDTARVEPDFTGWFIYIYSGNGQGQERRVTAFDTNTKTITVTPSWTTTPAAGDRYELHSLFTYDDYQDAMRMAQIDVADLVLVPIANSSLTLATTQYEYDVPAGFSHIFAVQVNIWSDEWENISPAAWGVIRSIRKVWIDPSVAAAYSSRKLRLLGLRPPTDLLDDMTGVDIKPTFIIKKTAANLCLMKMQSRENEPAGWTIKHQIYETQAMVDKQTLNKAIPPNTKRIE